MEASVKVGFVVNNGTGIGFSPSISVFPLVIFDQNSMLIDSPITNTTRILSQQLTASVTYLKRKRYKFSVPMTEYVARV
jgi:hypothetical protein